MQLTVWALAPRKHELLMPAPSLADWDYIYDIIKRDTTNPITDLMAQPLEVLTTYRGSLLYCGGGVTVHRIDPKSQSGNGLVSMPGVGIEEDVHINTVVGNYAARVRFEESPQYF